MMLLCIMKMPGNRAETICILGKIVNSHFNAFNLVKLIIRLNLLLLVRFKDTIIYDKCFITAFRKYKSWDFNLDSITIILM